MVQCSFLDGTTTYILNLRTRLWRVASVSTLPPTSGQTIPIGDSFLAIGGTGKDFLSSNDIFSFDSEIEDFVIQPQNLQHSRFHFGASLIPQDYVEC